MRPTFPCSACSRRSTVRWRRTFRWRCERVLQRATPSGRAICSFVGGVRSRVVRGGRCCRAPVPDGCRMSRRHWSGRAGRRPGVHRRQSIAETWYLASASAAPAPRLARAARMPQRWAHDCSVVAGYVPERAPTRETTSDSCSTTSWEARCWWALWAASSRNRWSASTRSASSPPTSKPSARSIARPLSARRCTWPQRQRRSRWTRWLCCSGTAFAARMRRPWRRRTRGTRPR